MNQNKWLLLFFGFWLVVSPWVLGFSDYNLPLWNNSLVGLLVFILVLSDKLHGS